MEPEKTELSELQEKAKESEANGSASFMDPQPKKQKNKGGRPKGSKNSSDPKKPPESAPQAPPKPAIPTKYLMYPIGGVLSKGAVLAAKHPGAGLNDKELEEFAEAFGDLFDKYFPDLMQNYGIELRCAMFMGSWGVKIVMLRRAVEKDMQQRAEMEKRNAQQHTGQETQAQAML